MSQGNVERGASAQGAIGFAIRECSLGRVLIAASERGICHVRFGESERDLERQLQTELPFATFERDEIRLKPWIDALIACIEGYDEGSGDGHSEGGARIRELPLDVAASRFQRRVWGALMRIPRGETRSYSDVARAVGLPKGARAVARACATNPVAVLVPCHRVVAQNGDLGGYRWGIERKRALLAREGAEVALD